MASAPGSNGPALVIDVQAIQDRSQPFRSAKYPSRSAKYIESLVVALLRAATEGDYLALLISPFEPVPGVLLAAVSASAAAVEWLPLPIPSLHDLADGHAVQQAYESLPLNRARCLFPAPLEGFGSPSTCGPFAAPGWASQIGVLIEDLTPFWQPERYLDPDPDFESWYRQRLRFCAGADVVLTPTERLAQDARYCLGDDFLGAATVASGPLETGSETDTYWRGLATTLGVVLSPPAARGGVRRGGLRRGGQPRVTVTGPLPPTPSGISIYIENQTRAAVNRVDVSWVDSQDHPDAPRDPEPIPSLPRSDGTELWWHHVANHRRFHTRQLGFLAQHRGVIELHEIDLPFLVPSILVPPAGIEAPRDLRDRLSAVFGAADGYDGRAEKEGLAVLLRWLARNSDAFVVHSTLAQSMLAALSIPDDSPPIYVVPHGSWVSEEARNAALSGPADVPPRPYVVVPGFVGPAKWPEGLVASVAAVPDQLRPLLVFAGRCPPHLQTKLEEYARRLQVDIVVTGYLLDADFDTWLARASAALVGRLLVRGETSGAVLSAARMGTPTVVASGGSVAEIPCGAPLVQGVDLAAHEVGLVLAEVLAGPISAPTGEVRHQMFRAMVPTLRASFSWEPTVDLMVDLWQKRGS